MRFIGKLSGQRIFLFVAAVAPVVLLISITIYDFKRTVVPEDSGCMDGGHKCNHNSTVCIHHSQWCDGNEDCPSGEDEEQRICHDGGSLSSDLATCLHNMNGAMSEIRHKVISRTSAAMLVVFDYCTGLCNCKRFPTISCRKKELLEIPQNLPNNTFNLILSMNNISEIKPGMFRDTKFLQGLKLDRNFIKNLASRAFADLHHLERVLSENNISSLPLEFQETSTGYSTIEHLDVANNPITWISQETLLYLPNLFSLNLSGVPVINLNKRSFQSMRNFFSIEFSTFEMCRYAPSVLMCKPKTDGISTIYNLLDLTILGIFVWIVGMVTCFGNLLVMICRTAFNEEKNIHSLFIKNLAAADFMLGVYLLVIGSHDVMYRDHYNKFALDWMESWTCRATGFMGVMSIEVSVFILTCMSLECCLTVCFPFQPRTMTVGRATGLLTAIWLSGAVIAGVPILFVSHFGQFYGSNGVCLPLYIHDPYMGGWQYSTFIFNFVNVIGMLVIIASYSIIFYNMRRTRARIPVVLTTVANSGGTIVTDDQLIRKMKNLDKRLFFIVLTNILCWIPLSVIKLLALYSVQFPSLSHAWLTIFIIPINSALNPIIYSVTTPTFRRKFKTCCNLSKIQDDFRKFALSLRTHLRGSDRPRCMSKVSGGTAMSFLGLQDILLLHRYRVSSASSQNRNEESFETHRLNNDARFTTVTIEYKHSKRKTLPSRMRAFSLTGAEVLLAVPKVGWSMIPRRNSLGPGLGYAFRETFVRSTQL